MRTTPFRILQAELQCANMFKSGCPSFSPWEARDRPQKIVSRPCLGTRHLPTTHRSLPRSMPPWEVEEGMMTARTEILAQFKEVAAEQDKRLAPLTDNVELLNTGL